MCALSAAVFSERERLLDLAQTLATTASYCYNNLSLLGLVSRRKRHPLVVWGRFIRRQLPSPQEGSCNFGCRRTLPRYKSNNINSTCIFRIYCVGYFAACLLAIDLNLQQVQGPFYGQQTKCRCPGVGPEIAVEWSRTYILSCALVIFFRT